MKSNKTLYIALAAGIAVTGLLVFLLGTETGKEYTSKIKSKGTTYADKFEDVLTDAKEKFSSVKKEYV
jgi:hypothetical protein